LDSTRYEVLWLCVWVCGLYVSECQRRWRYARDAKYRPGVSPPTLTVRHIYIHATKHTHAHTHTHTYTHTDSNSHTHTHTNSHNHSTSYLVLSNNRQGTSDHQFHASVNNRIGRSISQF